MKSIEISILLSVFTVLSSCTFSRYVQGVVIDTETKLPVSKVIVKIVEENNLDLIVDTDSFVYTDSLGGFELLSPTAGLFICPKMTLSFEKEGYNEVIKKYRNWNKNVVILLKKQAE